MRHARDDYNDRIVDSEGVIPKDEPVFLIRGQDKFAPAVLRMYAHLVESANGDPEIVKKTREWSEFITNWQNENGSKYPDV